MQIVQYMDLRHTIDINPPTFHYVTYKVSFVTIHFTLLLHKSNIKMRLGNVAVNVKHRHEI